MAVNSDLTTALWYLGRGSGIVSMLMLTVVVALGIATRARQGLPGLPKFAVAAVHRNAGLLAVTFLFVHVVSLVLDPLAQLRLVDVVVPFLGSYRPMWLGLGTLALDFMVAIVVTSLLRARLGTRVWRAVHWLAYACWPVALLHGLNTGSDSGRLWSRALNGLCVVVVGAALAWRVSPTFTSAKTRTRPAPTADRGTASHGTPALQSGGGPAGP